MPPVPRIAIGPKLSQFAVDAVVYGGGAPVEVGESADGLVWLSPQDVAGLQEALTANADARWVQLPYAGVEPIAEAGVFAEDHYGRVWTCAKGAYAEPVAEHALALALAGLRHFPERVTATGWGEPKGTSLYDQEVTILGGGGITAALLGLMAPFRVKATVVRRSLRDTPGAVRTLSSERLMETLPGARVVFLALALTPDTRGVIDREALRAMDPNGWLVNVARGGHVVTDDLVAALVAGEIAGAALDVTDPEPLPAGHPLWTLPNAIVTPHTADWPEVVRELLAVRIAKNVALFAAGEPLEGVVDTEAGY